MSLFIVSCGYHSTSLATTLPILTQTKPTSLTLTFQATPTSVKPKATNTALPSPIMTPTPLWHIMPKGLYLFFRYDDDNMNGLYALSISDRQKIKILDEYINSAVKLPDNRHVILLDDPERIILDLQDGSTTVVQLPKEFADPYFIAFSPINDDLIWVAGYPLHNLPINGDGSFLYYYGSDKNLEFRIQGSWPVWSPDGKYVAYEQETYVSPPMSMTVPYADITLLAIPCRASTAEPCREMKLTHSSLAREARKPSWSPDSQLLAYECSTTNYDEKAGPQDIFTVSQDICMFDLSRMGFRQLTHTSDFIESYPLWSPVGDSLVFAGAPSQYEFNDLYLLNIKNGEIRSLTNTSDLSEIPLFWWNNQ